LNPICHLLALLGARSILHVSRIRVKLQNSYYTNVSTDLLATGRRSLGIRAAHSGNYWSEGTTWECFSVQCSTISESALACQKIPSLRSSYEIKMSVKHGGMTLTVTLQFPENLSQLYTSHNKSQWTRLTLSW